MAACRSGVEPVADAEPDTQARHQFDHHPPGQLRLAE
jgi:hypothetical protein